MTLHLDHCRHVRRQQWIGGGNVRFIDGENDEAVEILIALSDVFKDVHQLNQRHLRDIVFARQRSQIDKPDIGFRPRRAGGVEYLIFRAAPEH